MVVVRFPGGWGRGAVFPGGGTWEGRGVEGTIGLTPLVLVLSFWREWDALCVCNAKFLDSGLQTLWFLSYSLILLFIAAICMTFGLHQPGFATLSLAPPPPILPPCQLVAVVLPRSCLYIDFELSVVLNYPFAKVFKYSVA